MCSRTNDKRYTEIDCKIKSSVDRIKEFRESYGVITDPWLVLKTWFRNMSKEGGLLIRMSIMKIFGDFIYHKIDVDWYFPSIYDIYFDDDYVDDNIINNDNNTINDIIDGVLGWMQRKHRRCLREEKQLFKLC